ncbi:MAG: hypothetical protein ACK5K8_04605 [Pseudanabaena sp.]
MDDISGGYSQKIKKKTIAQAILDVMGETNRPMTSQEICQLILDRNLYPFNTNDPLKMVRDSLWRHDVKTGKRSSPNKFFVQDGKYWSPLENSNSPKEELTEDADMVEFEASLYDYLFDLEDLDSN